MVSIYATWIVGEVSQLSGGSGTGRSGRSVLRATSLVVRRLYAAGNDVAGT
jgi:hypothetical protein